MADAERIRDFFRSMYPQDTEGWFIIFTDDKHTEWFPTRSFTRAARYSTEQATTQNVWFGAGLRREQLKGRRGGEDDITVLPGFAADIDIKHPTVHKADNLPETEDDITVLPGFAADIDIKHPTVHKADNLPETIEDARKLIEAIPLHPTYLIFTGYGIQPWWLFREPWILTDQAERDAAKHLWRRLTVTLQATAKLRDWHVDSTFSLEHVFRVPGTRNHNVPDHPVEVTFLINSPGTRYNPSDFDPYL